MMTESYRALLRSRVSEDSGVDALSLVMAAREKDFSSSSAHQLYIGQILKGPNLSC